MMQDQERLDMWLGAVGLLRAKLSLVMKAIHETRQTCRQQMARAPEGLSPLMAQAQELFVEMLKAGEFVSTARDNLEQKNTQTFDEYLESWAVTQTEDRFRRVGAYLSELSETRIPGLNLDPEIWEEGLKLIDEVLQNRK
ncbi:MAG: hypothetical protein KC553_00185 [Nitrospina sp.]|nr:hypothetical protein [Nitrospina sp.]